MKITEIAGDTLSVKALIGAAEKINRLAAEHNVRLAVVDTTLVVYAAREATTDGGTVAVTVENPPRLVTVTPDDAPEPVAATDRTGTPHTGPYHYPDEDTGGVICACTDPCCQQGDNGGKCVCLTCTSSCHEHG